jgi:hypothetical protein
MSERYIEYDDNFQTPEEAGRSGHYHPSPPVTRAGGLEPIGSILLRVMERAFHKSGEPMPHHPADDPDDPFSD